jgi:hypothetical protein
VSPVVRLFVVLLAIVTAGACGAPAGAPCTTEGSGFSLSSPCATKCLDLWKVRCPGGAIVSPQLCAGEEGCTPGSCPDGQACYHFEDPFEVRAYCVPVSACAGLGAGSARVAWERESEARAARVRQNLPAEGGSE